MLDSKVVCNIFSLLRQRFQEESSKLNALDAAIGDGDHGYTVSRAFTAAEKAVLAQDGKVLGELFDIASQAIAESSGGAVGPLLAAWFSEGGLVFRGKTQVDQTDFARFLTGGAQAIEEVGGARVGDKTMLDALIPAVGALQASLSLPLPQCLAEAADAAERGAQLTKGMKAKFGRAHFLGDRSVGHVDPGAMSTGIILRAFADGVSGAKAKPVSISEKLMTRPAHKLINDPEDLVQEDNEGLVLAYPTYVDLTPDGILTRATPKEEGKVGLCIGHGGGHTPSMGGLVGYGLLDADVYGPIFTCASGVRIAKAIQAADRGTGVVLLVSNHAGDVLNARLALRRCQQDGINVVPVYLGDDIATAPRESYKDRRGLGGLLFALKIGGAAAEEGMALEDVIRLMEMTNERTASLAVAVRAPTHPITGEPLFTLPDGMIEVGTGVHGEVGVYRGTAMAADDLVDLLLERLCADIAIFPERNLVVLLNGSGGTSRMELHILYRRVHQRLTALGYSIHAAVVDSLFTTQEMGGFSLSLCLMTPEMQQLWDRPANSPNLRLV